MEQFSLEPTLLLIIMAFAFTVLAATKHGILYWIIAACCALGWFFIETHGIMRSIAILWTLGCALGASIDYQTTGKEI